ncbi:MAG: M50 family metallopeptidase [Lachnospiraceae bacterium]|nr:M50 family metallopeptidase [Lachnospiraceae bacterium]
MLYQISEKIITSFNLPDNIFLTALISTLLILIAVLAVGWLIRLISELITSLLASVIGPGPAFIIRNYVTYIGTIHHEFAHAIVATVTGGKVTKINLFPKGQTLGSVEFYARGPHLLRGLQLSLTAIAPILCGGITLRLMQNLVYPNCTEIWHHILYWYAVISIFFHMTLSGKDMENFWKGSIPTLLIVYVINLICLALG